MKSAEEWTFQYFDGCIDSQSTAIFADFIRAIQRDAIKAAAEKAMNECGIGDRYGCECKSTGCVEILSLLPED